MWGYIPIQDNIIKYYQWMFFFFFKNQYDIYLWPIYPDARASMSGLGGNLHSRDGVDIAHGRPGQGVEDLIDVWLEMLRWSS